MPHGFPERAILPCPFCSEGISVLYIPRSIIFRKKERETRNEEWISTGPCGKCGNSPEMIMKEYRRQKSEKKRTVFKPRFHMGLRKKVGGVEQNL